MKRKINTSRPEISSVKDMIKVLEHDTQKNPVAVKESDILPPALMQELEDKLPEWVKELARDGTAVLRWNFEFFILIEEILRRDHNFSEADLVSVEKRVKEMLPVVHKMKIDDPHQLRMKDFQLAMGIVDEHKKALKQEAGRIAIPSKSAVKQLGGKKK